MLDMTDYETEFVSYCELPEIRPHNLGAVDGNLFS